MLVTSEYTVLVRGDEKIEIKPNTPFEKLPEGYKPTCSATVRDENGHIVAILAPGQETAKLSQPIKKSKPRDAKNQPKPKPKPKVVEAPTPSLLKED